MARRSLRTVLTVWNAGALAGLLTLFGTAIVLANQNRVRSAIDDDLRHQAERAARLGPPGGRPNQQGGAGFNGQRGMGGPGPDGGGFGGGPGQGGDPDQMPPGPEGEGPGQGQGQRFDSRPGFGQGGQQVPLPEVYAEAGRLADMRRPRFFGFDGSPNPFDPAPAFDQQSLAAALKGQAAFSDALFQGERIRVIALPIIREGKVVGAVEQAQELRGVDLLLATQWRTLAAFIPLAILAAAAGAYALTARTLRPIRGLTRAAAEISHSDLSRRLEVTGEDEMAELATTFNGMLGRLQTSFTELETAYGNLARAYEQQQRFTADASHELRTPLTRLRLATSSALEEARSPEEMRRALETADRAAVSMTRLVQDLLTLAKADAGQLPLRREPVDLRVVVADALEDVNVQRPVDTGFSDKPLMIRADAEHLRRVVTNLIENAARHTPAEGSIRVEAVRAQNHAVVSVRDTGEGIPPEHMSHIFERFYRADNARARRDGGSGLGLAICKNLVEAHDGRLEIESSPGVGTTVRAIFPLFSEATLTQTESS